jgi:imidazolonepropionase-like amidohydrolase
MSPQTRIVPQLLAAIVITAVSGSAAAQEPGPDGIIPQPYWALANTHVIDVRTGNILNDAVVVVREGLIESVGTGSPPANAELVDMEGKYLLPGFMDGHWHGRTLDNLRRALESGVTTAKSAGADGQIDLSMRDAVEAGYLAGPELLAAGVYVNRFPGASAFSDPRLYKYLNVIVKGEDAVREVVRVNAEMGVDWIKTRTGGTASSPGGWDPKTEVYTLEEITALVEEASSHAIPVSCHAHGEHVINNAIRGGCRTIEHGFYITEANLRLMLEHGTVWNPTYTSVEGYMFPHDDYNSSASRMRAPWTLHNMRRMLALAHELGVPIITSTDTQYGPRSNTRISGEIINFVEYAGMSPLEAIQSATIVSASVYGLSEETGAIEVGLEADFVAYDRNPLKEVHVLSDPMFVMSNGRLVYHRTITAEGYVAPKSEWTGYGRGGPIP